MEGGAIEHPNVAIVRSSFAKTMEGDIPGAKASWAPGARYHAFDAEAIEPRDVLDIEEIVRSGQELLARHDNEIVDIRPVGDELVVLQLRVTATSRTGKDMQAEYLIVLCVRDGLIQWACDFIDRSIQAFLDDAWS